MYQRLELTVMVTVRVETSGRQSSRDPRSRDSFEEWLQRDLLKFNVSSITFQLLFPTNNCHTL